MIQRPLSRNDDFVQVERLCDEIIGAETNCLNGAVTGTVGGNDDHRNGLPDECGCANTEGILRHPCAASSSR